LAVAEFKRGHIDEAIAESLKALQLYPNHVESLQAVAWLWATDPDPQRHRPNEALAFAEKACRLTNFKSPYALQVLAAAQAATNQFDKAVETAQTALSLLRHSAVKPDNHLEQELTVALELYRSGLLYYRH
jgi:tetratricopeptide (TPR) repeat protein